VCTKHSVRSFYAEKTTCGFWNASAVQFVTEIDTLGPRIWVDELVHVTCGDGENVGPENPNIGYPKVIDLCQGEIPTSALHYRDDVEHLVEKPPHCLDKITRHWTVEDVCGNRGNATQTIYATRHCAPCGGEGECKGG
jgi:hypothetical protein